MSEVQAFGRRYLAVAGVRYDYAADKCLCPVCGGVGWPWGGWFTCDAACMAIALVETGQVFLPAAEKS